MIDLTKIKYKCEEHYLNVACLGCVKANYNKLDKLLEFVLTFSGKVHSGNCKDLGLKAADLLREIGEL